MSPTPRAAAIAAGLAVATPFIGPSLTIALAVVLAVLVAVDSSRVRTPPDVRRTAPDRLSRGIPSPIEVVVRTRRPFRVRQPQPADITVGPREARGQLRGTITAHRRGRHVLSPPVVRLFGPLGLGAWTHRVGMPDEVLVYPDLLNARRIAHTVRTGRFRDEGHRSRGDLGLGTEFESIRDYQPDDDVRQVNWKATARMGRPMSNQYRLEQDREVLCLVDTGRLMAAEVGGRTRLDAALDAVAAVASVADVLGDRVGLLAFDERIRREVPAGRSNADRVLHAAFDLEPEPVDTDYLLGFRTAASWKRSLVLVFTDLFEEAAAQPLVDAASVLTRHHAVVVASVDDHDIDEVLTTPPGDATGAARVLVAHDVREGRRRASARIEAAGATVVEAPEDDLARRCVAAYLSAKARAKL
ncbi:MAG: DUF58 domain-containing protein [Acidimicrobiia bacterium]|nr:DUF58 domain-containing protein [Acidimicrobiia bacterium]